MDSTQNQVDAPCDACGLGPYEVEYLPICQTNTHWVTENRPDYLCTDCFATFIHQYTTLSEQETIAYVHKYSGHSQSSVASRLDVDEPQVVELIREINSKLEKTKETHLSKISNEEPKSAQ